MTLRSKGFGTIGILLLLLGISGIIFLAYNTFQMRQNLATPGDPVRGMVVSLKNTKPAYTKDRYVEVTLTVANKSGKEQYFAWDNCAEIIDYYVDGKQKNTDVNGMCMIGFPPLENKKTLSRNLQYDPSDLKPGRHNLQLTINGIPSNKLELQISGDTKPIVNCYAHTEYLTPLCANLVIHTNVSSIYEDENNNRCNMIKQAWINNTPLRPIPSLSTVNCNDGKSAYFVANVPTSELEDWRQKLRAADYNSEIFTEDTTLRIDKL
ncbi:MAG TPA: hypothetical protein VF572_03590 [Candidatus Saccharimonadales bacterium]|jgi:hypothetical protein